MSKTIALGTFAKAGCPFFKVDDEHGIAFGWAIISTIDGEPYFDTQGDHIPMTAVMKAAERFMKDRRAGDDQHDERRQGDIPFALPVDKTLAKSLFGVEIEMEGLVIGFKPYDKSLLQKIKDGERRGFSIGGALYSAKEVEKSLLGKSIAIGVRGRGREIDSVSVIESFTKARATKAQTKRIFEDFEIDFISSVDWPAQEPALITIVKSLDGKAQREPVLWMRKAAMPPKKDEGESEGDKKKPAAQPTQASGQQAQLAQNPATAPAGSMMTQAAAAPLLPTANMAPAPTGALPMAPNGGSLPIPQPKLTGEDDGHQHAIDLSEVGENGIGYTGFGISSVGVSHRHAFVMNPDGSVTIATNDGHSHTPDGSAPPVELDENGDPIETEDGPPSFGSDKAKDEFGGEEDVDPDAMPPFDRSAKPSDKKPSREAAGDASSDEETDDEASGGKKPAPFASRKRARNSVQISDLGVGLENKETAMDAAQQIAALKKQLDNATAYGELNDAQKAHYRTLAKRDQQAFLDMSNADREAEIKKAADADPVLYTTKDGTEIRKSDGKLVLLQAKKLDAQEDEIKKAREERQSVRFEKRAETEMRHYPKAASIRGRIIKAIETEFAAKDPAKPTDAEKKAREEALAVIKAGDKALSKSYTRSGVSADRGSDEVDDDSPEAAEDKLEKMAKKYAKENKVSFHKAYDAVVSSPEGEALYNKAMGHDVDDFYDDDEDPSVDDLDGEGDDGDGDDDDEETVEDV